MEFWYMWVLLIVVGLIGYGVTQAMIKAHGRGLRHNFANLRELEGKTLSEIQSACGAPNETYVGENGIKIYQWIATYYHIALLFDENDICLGVSYESKV